MNNLGERKSVIEHPRAGLFGNKISKVDIYENGIELFLKSEKKRVFFDEISSINATDYFAPNPRMFEIIIKDRENKKIISFMVYPERIAEVTDLLTAHKDFVLSNDFPNDILTSKYALDDYLAWDNGCFSSQYGKNINKIPLSEVDSYYEKGDMPCFKLKNGKTMSVNLLFTVNPLISLTVSRAVGSMLSK